MNEPYKVSIGVPVYGVEKYIERCARSLFDQTYEDIEYIFVDDCTPDKSIEVLKNVLEDYPNRINQVRIIRHEKNRGLAAARNTFIDNTSGEFVWSVDSDDYVEIEAVEKLVSKQQEANSELVIMGHSMIHPAGHKSIEHVPHIGKEELLKGLLNGSIAHGIWSCFIRSSLYKTNNIHTIEGCNMAEDYCVTPRLVYCATNVAVLDDPLYVYVNTNDSSYTNVISEETELQYRSNLKCVRDFFEEKGETYLDQINQYEAYGIVWSLAKLARVGGQRERFRKTQSELAKIQKKYIRSITLPYRVFCYINNYTLLHIYARFCAVVKHWLESRRR